jgi:hypothetical protein
MCAFIKKYSFDFNYKQTTTYYILPLSKGYFVSNFSDRKLIFFQTGQTTEPLRRHEVGHRLPAAVALVTPGRSQAPVHSRFVAGKNQVRLLVRILKALLIVNISQEVKIS